MSQPVKLSDVLVLCKKAAVKPLSQCLETVDTPGGRNCLGKYLDTLPFPHYEPAPHKPGFLVRIEENGKRRNGRFVNRKFHASSGKK